MTIQQDAASLKYGKILEFVELEIPGLIATGNENDPSEYFRVYNSYNTGDADGQITFLGVTWDPLPFVSEGFEMNGEGGTPRPTLTLADFEGIFLAASLQYQDFIGCTATRYETTTANRASGSFYGPEKWTVNCIVESDGMMIKLELASPTDVKSRKIPGVLMFRDRYPSLGRNRKG